MPVRKANSEWRGDLKSGSGNISTESGVLKSVAYNFVSRFDKGNETNPEELLGAAHSACFSMALSLMISTAGYKVNFVRAEDKVHIDKVGDGFSITKIDIHCEASIEGIDLDTFNKLAEDAKKGCPVSKALAGVEFSLTTNLLK
ncbi:MAG: OsmC family protein [Ignavibacteriaceae bacterium]|nr:OsmC family protein [Ignavibacteriaceae bacterium]